MGRYCRTLPTKPTTYSVVCVACCTVLASVQSRSSQVHWRGYLQRCIVPAVPTVPDQTRPGHATTLSLTHAHTTPCQVCHVHPPSHPPIFSFSLSFLFLFFKSPVPSTTYIYTYFCLLCLFLLRSLLPESSFNLTTPTSPAENKKMASSLRLVSSNVGFCLM